VATWGALNVNSGSALREALEHTAVATLAYVCASFRDSRDRLGVAWFACDGPGGSADTGEDGDPAAPLRWMAGMAGVLRRGGADPRWYGRNSFLWAMDAPGWQAAADAASRAVRAGLRHHPRLRCGAAHGTEAGDPADLIRLAAYRCERAASGSAGGTARPALVSERFEVSDAEQARLEIIARNRGRAIEPLVREALDLLSARYA
jgi:hypothetical protein